MHFFSRIRVFIAKLCAFGLSAVFIAWHLCVGMKTCVTCPGSLLTHKALKGDLGRTKSCPNSISHFDSKPGDATLTTDEVIATQR